MYCLLDLFLANTFFVFPHRDATLEIYVWGRMPGGGWPQSIPIEEFLFYITGFLAILLTYIWCDHYWLSEYHMEVKTPEKPRAEAISHGGTSVSETSCWAASRRLAIR